MVCGQLQTKHYAPQIQPDTPGLEGISRALVSMSALDPPGMRISRAAQRAGCLSDLLKEAFLYQGRWHDGSCSWQAPHKDTFSALLFRGEQTLDTMFKKKEKAAYLRGGACAHTPAAPSEGRGLSGRGGPAHSLFHLIFETLIRMCGPTLFLEKEQGWNSSCAVHFEPKNMNWITGTCRLSFYSAKKMYQWQKTNHNFKIHVLLAILNKHNAMFIHGQQQ